MLLSALLLQGVIGYQFTGLSRRVVRLSMSGLVDEGELGACYTSNMNLDDTVKNMFDSNDYIWESVKNDLKTGESEATYLNEIEAAMLSFVKSRRMWGGEELAARLDKMRDLPGQLVILTGGPSTGKSLLITDYVKKLEDRDESGLIVDGRAYRGPLEVEVLGSVSKAKYTEDSKSFQEAIIEAVRDIFPAGEPVSGTRSMNMVVKSIMDAGMPLKFIFLDEANAYFKEGN
jgi:hypothetical protein